MTDIIKDIYPDKAQYITGELPVLVIELYNPPIPANIHLRIEIYKLAEKIFEKSLSVNGYTEKAISIELIPFHTDWQGYGVDIYLEASGELMETASTAFDVVSSWKKTPRFGFLSGFSPDEYGSLEDVLTMKKFHLNVVQFYDWMYKHEDLLPEEEIFIDPLGRELSLLTEREKIKSCHENGMKALAYGAIYGASKDFFTKHKDWALYKNDDSPYTLGDWLYIMNISPESPWTAHIIEEYRKALIEMKFDGIHLDTYGFPKKARSRLSNNTSIRNLGKDYPVFINSVRKELEKIDDEIGIFFNAVNNWAIEKVAPSAQDVLYIEVWPPHTRYHHLYTIIRRAKELANKPVILAAYLSPFANPQTPPDHSETSFLLASAVIFASGAYHLILGEKNGVLSDPYYVNHSFLRGSFIKEARNYYDFIVRYGNLLMDPAAVDLTMTHVNGIESEFQFSGIRTSSTPEPETVWSVIREVPGYIIIHLINFYSITSDLWNEGKSARPSTITGKITLKALLEEKIISAHAASPDKNSCKPTEISFRNGSDYRGKLIFLDLPPLSVWNVIFIQFE